MEDKFLESLIFRILESKDKKKELVKSLEISLKWINLWIVQDKNCVVKQSVKEGSIKKFSIIKRLNRLTYPKG